MRLLAVWFVLWVVMGGGGQEAHAAVQRAGTPVAEMPVDSVPLGGMTVQVSWRLQASNRTDLAGPAVNEDGWIDIPAEGLPRQIHFRPFQPLWYRTHLRVRRGAHDLAMVLGLFPGPLQVYVNGVLVGEYGHFGPGAGAATFPHEFLEIPDRALGEGELTLAVRTDAGPEGLASFKTQRFMFLGPRAVLKEDLTLLAFQNYVSNAVEVGIEALLLLLSVALMLALRRDREYRALALLVASLLASDALHIVLLQSGRQSTPWTVFFETNLDAVSCVLLLGLVRTLLRVPRTKRARRVYWGIGLCAVPFCLAVTLQMYAVPVTPVLREAAWWVYHAGVALPQFALPFACIWFAFRRKAIEPLLLALPLLLEGGLLLTGLLAHLHLTPNFYTGQLVIGHLYVQWMEISRIFMGSALLVLVMLRTVRIARERAAIAGELQAARTVQQMLLGEAVVATPGFRVESAYLPASEVGGDFFFVAPGEHGSLLVVAGDVSGKGLRAAMTVSAIVGALRSLPERAPARVLQQLNRVLVGHMEGFATCCVAVLEADGAVRLANAGHLSPYLNGTELALAANLPLGVAEGLEFEESEAQMPVLGRLVFVSDGVVEATDPRSRELLGFERTAALTSKSARGIAREAKRFGQTDDITVVSVERLAL